MASKKDAVQVKYGLKVHTSKVKAKQTSNVNIL